MVAVNANERLKKTYTVEELEEDANAVSGKLESLKYILKHKMTNSENNYHIIVDKLIADTETRIKSMRCNEDTMVRVKTARQYGWGSFKQCVELTRALADGEMVVYDTVVYLEDLLHLFANITKDVSACRHSSLFKAMSCVIQTFANHSDDFKQKSDAILTLFNRMDNITNKIHQTLHGCINGSKALVSDYIDNIVLKNCEKQSFFKGMLDSIKSNLNYKQKVTLPKTMTEKKRLEAPKEEHRLNALLGKHLKTLSEEHQQKTLSEKRKKLTL